MSYGPEGKGLSKVYQLPIEKKIKLLYLLVRIIIILFH